MSIVSRQELSQQQQQMNAIFNSAQQQQQQQQQISNFRAPNRSNNAQTIVAFNSTIRLDKDNGRLNYITNNLNQSSLFINPNNNNKQLLREPTSLTSVAKTRANNNNSRSRNRESSNSSSSSDTYT